MSIPTIFYPSDYKTFQNIFLKLQVLDKRASNLNEVLHIIYLPIPKGLFSENYQIGYEQKDLGIGGELVKRNYQGISNIISKITFGTKDYDSEEILNAGVDVTKRLLGDTVGALKTRIEKELLGGTMTPFLAAYQGLGYAFAPNYTLMFNGVDYVRLFNLEWKMYPRNKNDAENAEQIIKVIEEAALPKLTKDVVDKIARGISNVVSDVIQLSPAERVPAEEGEEEGSFIEPIVTFFGDVVYSVTAQDQLYPSTFEIPHGIKLSIVERNERNDLNEINYLMDLPYHFVINNVIVERSDIGDSPGFIKFSEDNTQTYYSNYYSLQITLTEEKVLTADDIN